MNKMNKTLTIILALVVAVAIGATAVILQVPQRVMGSVFVGQQYQSTTTPQVADMTNVCPGRFGISSSTTGILGSVNVMISGGGEIVIYDATTTNSALRTPMATSSMILALIPASATVGSYHFDVAFSRGLLIDTTGTGTGVSSTTISYRCER